MTMPLERAPGVYGHQSPQGFMSPMPTCREDSNMPASSRMELDFTRTKTSPSSVSTHVNCVPGPTPRALRTLAGTVVWPLTLILDSMTAMLSDVRPYVGVGQT